MRRQVFRVKPLRGGWVVVSPGGRNRFHMKRIAVEIARAWARSEWRENHTPAQLVVHGRDGRIQYEHTYGNDPRRRQG